MLTYNGKILKYNGKWIQPYVPLPPLGTRHIRFQFSDTSYVPFASMTYGIRSASFEGTWTAVDASKGIWDWDVDDPQWSTDWSGKFWSKFSTGNGFSADETVKVLEADLTGIVNAKGLFYNSPLLVSADNFTNTGSLETIEIMFYGSGIVHAPAFDTSSVLLMAQAFNSCTLLLDAPGYDLSSLSINTQYSQGSHGMMDMFGGCTALTAIPMFTNIPQADIYTCSSYFASAFYGCVNVESGALDLYDAMIDAGNLPSFNTNMFQNCGSNTVTGAAELAQIPASWGGTLNV